jgi:hypothetical protein
LFGLHNRQLSHLIARQSNILNSFLGFYPEAKIRPWRFRKRLGDLREPGGSKNNTQWGDHPKTKQLFN